MDSKLENRLRKFVGLINKKTGITNFSDYNHCIDMFESIGAEGIPFDCEEIRAWLVSAGGLQARDAKDVKTMAVKFHNGKMVKRR